MLLSKQLSAGTDGFSDAYFRIFQELKTAGDDVLPLLEILLGIQQQLQQHYGIVVRSTSREDHSVVPQKWLLTEVSFTSAAFSQASLSCQFAETGACDTCFCSSHTVV